MDRRDDRIRKKRKGMKGEREYVEVNRKKEGRRKGHATTTQCLNDKKRT